MRLWFIATVEDLLFYIQCKKNTGESFYLVHLNLLTYLAAVWLRVGSGSLVFRRGPTSGARALPDFDVDETRISTCFNVLAGRLNQEDARHAYVATLGLIQKLNSKSLITKFVIPSGRHIHHLAATDFAKKNEISRLYINYGNFPGRTFFDPLGTDAESSVYVNGIHPPESFTEREAKLIIRNALSEKSNQSSIPQKTTYFKEIVKSLAFRFSVVAESWLGICGDRRIISLPERGPVFFADIVEKEALERLPPFFFFPLQVSSDVQVVRNYDGGSIENSIKQALAYTKKKGKILVVKLHPAEKDQQTVIRLLDLLKKTASLKTANLPTDILIKYAEKVVTINSTVGLEAKLLDREVHFMGKSMYADMDARQMAWYLRTILIKVDYHSGKGSAEDFCRVKELLQNESSLY